MQTLAIISSRKSIYQKSIKDDNEKPMDNEFNFNTLKSPFPSPLLKRIICYVFDFSCTCICIRMGMVSLLWCQQKSKNMINAPGEILAVPFSKINNERCYVVLFCSTSYRLYHFTHMYKWTKNTLHRSFNRS